MTRAELEKSLRTWKRREHYRYRKWRMYVGLLKPGHRLREKWFDLYEEARAKRRRREKQLSHLGVTGISSRGVALIKEFEGFYSRPYRDPVGVWTIGYGHVEGVSRWSKPLSEKEASALLRRDLDRKYFPYVKALPVFRSLNQNQVDALTSFVYNVGPGGISSSTGVGRMLRAKKWIHAADELLRWDKGGGRTLPGLTRRRHAERTLFLKK